MTTIFFSKDQVAADTKMVYGLRVSSNSYNKLIQTDKYIIGFAGRVGQCQRIADWIAGDFVDDEGNPCIPYIPDNEPAEYELAYIDKCTGKIFCVEGATFDIIEHDYPVALGSGADFALGYALAKSKNTKDLAKKAVKAASKYCVMTNDSVNTIDVILIDNSEVEDEDIQGNK